MSRKRPSKKLSATITANASQSFGSGKHVKKDNLNEDSKSMPSAIDENELEEENHAKSEITAKDESFEIEDPDLRKPIYLLQEELDYVNIFRNADRDGNEVGHMPPTKEDLMGL
jgi:hypothetical protein